MSEEEQDRWVGGVCIHCNTADYVFISEFLTEYGSLLVLESATDTPDAKRAIFVNQLFNSLIELRSMASSSLFSGTLTILFEILLKQNK